MKKKRDTAMGIRGNRRFWTDVFWVVNWNGGMTRGLWVGSEWDGVVAVPHLSPQRDLPSCHLWIRFPQTQCPAPPSAPAPAHVHTPQWVPDPHGSHGSLSVWNRLTEHSGKSVAYSEEGSGSEEDEEDQADLGKRRGPSFFFFFCFECCVPPRQPLTPPFCLCPEANKERDEEDEGELGHSFIEPLWSLDASVIWQAVGLKSISP